MSDDQAAGEIAMDLAKVVVAEKSREQNVH
jgi:hypothetical protein